MGFTDLRLFLMAHFKFYSLFNAEFFFGNFDWGQRGK
jgi:hypothetical protein